MHNVDIEALKQFVITITVFAPVAFMLAAGILREKVIMNAHHARTIRRGIHAGQTLARARTLEYALNVLNTHNPLHLTPLEMKATRRAFTREYARLAGINPGTVTTFYTHA